MRGLLLIIAVASCQGSDAPKRKDAGGDKPVGSDKAAGSAGSGKPEYYALGGDNAKTPPSWAPAAIAQITAFRDAMCACNDRACGDKVSEGMRDWSKQFDASPEKPDAATSNKILELSVATAKCKPKGPEVVPTTNTALDDQALDLMDTLAVAIAAAGKDCAKLTSTIEHFTVDHRDLIARTHAAEQARTPAARKAFADRNRARTDAFTAKMKPAMTACKDDQKVKNASMAMAEVGLH